MGAQCCTLDVVQGIMDGEDRLEGKQDSWLSSEQGKLELAG